MLRSLKKYTKRVLDRLDRSGRFLRGRWSSIADPSRRVTDLRGITTSDSLTLFVEMLGKIPSPRVIELGTWRSEPLRSTTHESWVPHHSEYVGVDLFEGEDVDIVVDCHELSTRFPRGYFHAFISCSTFEHLKYPWIVALELNKILKIQGLGFVQTHQTFPIHAYPQDYWRYTTEAFGSLFNEHTGFKILNSDYTFPCVITPLIKVAPWDRTAPSFVNANVLVQKIQDLSEDSFKWKRLI